MSDNKSVSNNNSDDIDKDGNSSNISSNSNSNSNSNNNNNNKKLKKSHDNDDKLNEVDDSKDELKANESKTYEGVEYINSIPREEYYETNPNYKRKFFLRPMDQQPDEFWRKPTKIACYYCGYQFDKYNLKPIPIPTATLDNGQSDYEHIACTPTCSKSEINYNMRGYRRNEALEAFTLMMNDAYGYAGEVKVVEKARFKRYGGDLSQERYLKMYGVDLDLRMRTAPFIPKTYTLENPFADSSVKK